jgi:phospholipid N-methyltransferase
VPPIGGGMEISMDIRETLLELINSETIRYSYMAIEKLIIVMMKDYLGSQNKRLFAENEVVHGISDMILPDGIDSDDSCIAAEIKMYRHKQMSLRVIYDTIGRFSINRGEINKLLLIVVNELPDGIRDRIEEKKKQLNFELIIWDMDDLVRIFSYNESLFVDTYNNLNAVLLRDTINNGISRNNSTYLEKRKKYVEQLHTQYENDNIVLFLGAGASNEAKIATWDTLISELFVALIDKQLSANHIQIEKKDKKKIVKEVINQNGNSPLLQTRFLRNGFENDFEELVRDILYKSAVDTSDLLEEIGQLCIPNRGKLGVRAIINYNFDDLVEKNLKRLRVKYHSIYGEGMIPDTDELGIYHVHGFLPQEKENYENLTKSLLVFSEEGYHKLMLEPYNWANISQLNYMINNTCFFIGLSMTDPNMRRLLEIAAQKRTENDGECQHYAIMRRFKIKDSEEVESIKSFERVNESLQESFFKELGVNVLWIDEFSEIPILLKQIKGNYDSY